MPRKSVRCQESQCDDEKVDAMTSDLLALTSAELVLARERRFLKPDRSAAWPSGVKINRKRHVLRFGGLNLSSARLKPPRGFRQRIDVLVKSSKSSSN